MDRLTELRKLEILDEDEVIEYFMIKLGCSRDEAEQFFEKFASENEPVSFQ